MVYQYLMLFAGALGVGVGYFIFRHPAGAVLRQVLKFLPFLLLFFFLNAFASMSEATVYIATFIMFVVGIFAAPWLFKKAEGPRKKSTAFGSAKWATVEDMRKGKLIATTGLRLGTFKEERIENGIAASQIHALSYAGDRHLLTVAPTRSGKGVSAIIPNLLTHTGSAVVIDPKGENAMITATRRGEGNATIPGLGQKVYVVDPWGITGQPAACFNPLDWLKADDPDISENAMMLADCQFAAH